MELPKILGEANRGWLLLLDFPPPAPPRSSGAPATTSAFCVVSSDLFGSKVGAGRTRAFGVAIHAYRIAPSQPPVAAPWPTRDMNARASRPGTLHRGATPATSSPDDAGQATVLPPPSPRVRLVTPRAAAGVPSWALLIIVCAGALSGWALALPAPVVKGAGVAPRAGSGAAMHSHAALVPSLASASGVLRGPWRAAHDGVLAFHFTPGTTPLSRPRAPFCAVVAYFGMLAAAKALVRRSPRLASLLDVRLKQTVFGAQRFACTCARLFCRLHAQQLTMPVSRTAHNLLLCSLSAGLLTGLIIALRHEYVAHGRGLAGFMRIFCDAAPHVLGEHRIVAFFYANYLTKYYELLDTLLLVLRGRPTPFLHVFHHAATLVLCWSQLTDNTAVQWVPITLNLAVHIFMYYYYALATLGRRVWWKRWLTSLQIVQFAVDVPLCALALLMRVNAERGWGLFRGANTYCRGTHRAAHVGIGLLATYLVLFIKLYADTYLRRGEYAPAVSRKTEAGTGARRKEE